MDLYTTADLTDMDALDIALSSSALFDQYDEAERIEAANDDSYENLYPYIA